MSESILNALIHLFAIVAMVNRKGISEKGRMIVSMYLRRYLNEELTGEYLRVFDNYLDFYKRELLFEVKQDQKESDSLISFQITNVCRQIKKGLLRDERVIVILQLIEFVIEDNVLSPEENDFIETVARTFNISDSELNNIQSFIVEPESGKIEKDKLLIIDNQIKEWSENIAWFMDKKKKKKPAEKHIYKENLYGKILVLYIQSINSYVLSYFGQLNLYLEGHKIEASRTYFLNHGSIIKGPNIESIYFLSLIHISEPTRPY